MDNIIHEERISNKQKVTYPSTLNSLPDGTIIDINSKAYLIWKGKLFEWSYLGYTESDIVPHKNKQVIVLTPQSYVKTFAQGYLPEVHKSIK